MKRFRAVAFAGLTITSTGMTLSAQVPANLHGVVVNSQGTAVAGAHVTVSQGDRVVADRTTDSRGEFIFSAVPSEYRVLVSATDFEDLQSSPIPFGNRGTSRFTMLHPGEVLRAETRVRAAAFHRGWETGVQVQGGVGVSDRSDYHFLLLGGHAGKVMTPEIGSGILKGAFEYGVEVLPFWQAYTPHHLKISCTADPPAPAGSYVCSQPYTVGGTYTGVSITPIILRWDLTHGSRVMPWIQGAGGVLWTNHKFPAIGNTNPLDTASNGPHGDSSVWNFTPQFGVGAHYFLKSRQSVDISANAVHISSASLGDKNPGVNASVQFSVGYTWWK